MIEVVLLYSPLDKSKLCRKSNESICTAWQSNRQNSFCIRVIHFIKQVYKALKENCRTQV